MTKQNGPFGAFYLMPGICYLAEYVVWRSFPQSYFLNGILGGLWTMGQIGIIVLLLALYKKLIANGNAWRAAGVTIAILGALSYMANYVLGYWFHWNTKMLLPLGALLTGAGMVITGIQVLRARRWPSAFCFTPLVVGLYPFLVMFPLVMITGRPDLTAILCWGIPWLLLGIGMTRYRRAGSGT